MEEYSFYSLIEYFGLCFESLDSEELNSLADMLGIEKEKLEKDASEYLEAMKEMKALEEQALITIED